MRGPQIIKFCDFFAQNIFVFFLGDLLLSVEYYIFIYGIS